MFRKQLIIKSDSPIKQSETKAINAATQDLFFLEPPLNKKQTKCILIETTTGKCELIAENDDILLFQYEQIPMWFPSLFSIKQNRIKCPIIHVVEGAKARLLNGAGLTK